MKRKGIRDESEKKRKCHQHRIEDEETRNEENIMRLINRDENGVKNKIRIPEDEQEQNSVS